MKRAFLNGVVGLAITGGATAATAPGPDYLIALTITEPALSGTPAAFPKITVAEGTWGRVIGGQPFRYDVAVRPSADAARPGSIILSWQITTWPGGHARTLRSALSAVDGSRAGFSVADVGGVDPLELEVVARRLR